MAKGWKCTETQEQRFWRLTEKTSGCWNWVGAKTNAGYGVMCLKGQARYVYAHRYSFELHGGKLFPGVYVLHKCDIPSCVNPDHLYAGTQSDNLRDSWRRSGRVPAGFCNRPGELNHQAKLTVDVVQKIRSLAGEGLRHRDIAVEVGVHQTTVSRVIGRRTWAHVE